MTCLREYLESDDEALLADCDVQTYKASGPGGQHRNKTMSGVRLKHRPTGITAQSADSRSQHENRHRALLRMRMNIACRLRRPVSEGDEIPPAVRECLRSSAGGRGPSRCIEVNRKNPRYWTVVAVLLDLLEAREGRLSEAAADIGVSTSNFIKVLKADRHALAAAQKLRSRHGQKPLS
ncbi:MAG: peptide chain release factor family protein [Phycisphaerae bacterium]